MLHPVLMRIRAMEWAYAGEDPAALEALEGRLARTGRRRELIPRARLVGGIAFRLPGVAEGTPFELGVPDWNDLHRAVLDDFLARIACGTYEHGGFLASALVVEDAADRPGESFRQLARELGLVSSAREDDLLAFWSDQVRAAHRWYARYDR